MVMNNVAKDVSRRQMNGRSYQGITGAILIGALSWLLNNRCLSHDRPQATMKARTGLDRCIA
jgi:hypothetical protein